MDEHSTQPAASSSSSTSEPASAESSTETPNPIDHRSSSSSSSSSSIRPHQRAHFHGPAFQHPRNVVPPVDFDLSGDFTSANSLTRANHSLPHETEPESLQFQPQVPSVIPDCDPKNPNSSNPVLSETSFTVMLRKRNEKVN